MPADIGRYIKPNTLNTWESGFGPQWRPIKYRPIINGVPGTYDSGDPSVIDEHLAMMENTLIDFLIFDLTNFIDVDEAYIRKRAQAVASRIAEWNKNPTNRPIKYAIAIGAMQFTHNPKTMESEASKVLNMFVNNPEFGGPENYFYLEGKPLLVFYTSKDDRNEWEDWGNKSQTNHFTVRWAQGTVPINNFPPPEEYGLYYGWAYTQGSLQNKSAMVVMPGFNNNKGHPIVSRTYNNEEGGFYRYLCWDRVLDSKPQITIINSFNEYAEETAVAPTDTSKLVFPSEQWSDPYLYWNMTRQYNRELKVNIPRELKVNIPPIASFTFDPQNPIVDQTVTFDASTSYDIDGSIVSYGWEFGDRGTATGEIVTHSYYLLGDYIVNLTVTDDYGAKGSTSKTITVVPPSPPTISISTDSFKYSPGDTMTITIDIANPTEDSLTFQWYWGIPQDDFWHSVKSGSIPAAGYDDTVNLSFRIPNWGSTPFGNVFYMQLLDADGEVLDADITWWAYSPVG